MYKHNTLQHRLIKHRHQIHKAYQCLKYTLCILSLLGISVYAYPQKSNSIINSPCITQKLNINNCYSFGIPAIVDGILYFPAQTQNSPTLNNNTPFYKLHTLPLSHVLNQQTNAQQNTCINQIYHNGPVCYCHKTGELFVTQSNIINHQSKKNLFNTKNFVNLKIVIYTYTNTCWTPKTEFIHNSQYYSLAQPAINPGGDTLFFVSDMPGGYGKTDIYYCIRKNNEWSAPINAGPLVNSKKYEISPFISNNNTLFFASNRAGGHGKLDIYLAENFNSQKPQIVNAGKTINSRNNDFGFVRHTNQNIAFYISGNKRKNYKLYSILNANYTPQQTPLPLAQNNINNIVENINVQLKTLAQKMAKTNYIDPKLSFTCQYNITQLHTTPNLTLTFAYRLNSDTLKAGLNSYSLSQYTPQHSHPTILLLEALKHHLNNSLKTYINSSKNINLYIHTNTDAINVFSNTRYLGEYGPKLSAKIQTPDSIVDINLKQNQTINNLQLAFLRAQGIKQYITQNTSINQQQINTVHYNVNTQNTEKQNTNPYQTSISITIHNPFANY